MSPNQENILDSETIYQKLDSQNMRVILASLPDQCLSGWCAGEKLILPPNFKQYTNIIYLGMGGSAIAGDFLKNIVDLRGNTPIKVIRDYQIPQYNLDNSLVIASSYSGNTEETISCFRQIANLPCAKLIITSNGNLLDLAHSKDIPLLHINYKAPPRAIVGFTLYSLLAIANRLGILKIEEKEVINSVSRLKELHNTFNIISPVEINPAKKLALKLFNKLIIIYAAGFISTVALRWKTQINENSKCWAFSDTLPELNHNSIVGYQNPGTITDGLFVVLLQSLLLHKRTILRYELTSQLLSDNNIDHQIITVEGDGPLTEIMQLTYLGDYLSYYLSILYNIDPTPVGVIDWLKKKLSEVPANG